MKIKLLAAFLIWFCVFGNAVFAQKEHYVWYFGDHAGLDFNSGNPVALTNSAMNQWEGSSSIADANGNLLFYTDGISVWDRFHNQMPNGDSLAGGFSSTQSSLIVPFIGSSSLYYIFTVPNSSSNSDFTYSVVDLSLNSGNGDVTIKNNFILSPVTEKLTAVKHSNGTDIWVMVHEYSTNGFYAYLVTASGIASTPVVSNVGQVITGTDALGQMKFSADGLKVAFAAEANDYVDLFDFNTITGTVSNEIYLNATGPGWPYGLEFSQSATYLYCAKGDTAIYQWDISSGSAATINATYQPIGSGTLSHWGLQMGPDGKIYVAEFTSGSLGVINSPDLPGLSCNYVDNALSLSGETCRLGLPNFITSYFLPTGIPTNQPQQNQLTIFPNPATDKITISFAATTNESVTVKIYNITGELVFELKDKSTTPISNFQFPISNFQNGIYFLSVQTAGEMMTKKIVVNH